MSFKYLGLIFCKSGSTEGETQERALQGRKVVRSAGHIGKGRIIHKHGGKKKKKKVHHDSIIVLTMKYGN